MERQSIIERIRRYRALAGSNDNVHEAAQAMRRAKSLITEHRIAEHEISGATPMDVGEWQVPGQFNDGSRLSLLTCACQMYDCRAIRIMEVVSVDGAPVKTWEGKIVGRRQDADIVLYVFAYYEREVEDVVRSNGYHLQSKNREESFRRGVVYGIHRRITNEQKVRKKASTLPENSKVMVTTQQSHIDKTKVFLDTKYDQRERSSANHHETTDRSAFYDGYEAARRVSLIDQESAAVAALEKKEDKKEDQKDEKAESCPT